MVITNMHGAAVLSEDGTAVMTGEVGPDYCFAEVEFLGTPYATEALRGEWLKIRVTPRGFVAVNPSNSESWLLERAYVNERRHLVKTTGATTLRVGDIVTSIRKIDRSSINRPHGRIKAFSLPGS